MQSGAQTESSPACCTLVEGVSAPTGPPHLDPRIGGLALEARLGSPGDPRIARLFIHTGARDIHVCRIEYYRDFIHHATVSNSDCALHIHINMCHICVCVHHALPYIHPPMFPHTHTPSVTTEHVRLGQPSPTVRQAPTRLLQDQPASHKQDCAGQHKGVHRR